MFFDIGDKSLLKPKSLLLIFLFGETGEVLHGKLAIDRNNAGRGVNGGVDNVAGFEVILEGESLRREVLLEEVGEDVFADGAAKFGGVEEVLKVFHGAANFGEFAGF